MAQGWRPAGRSGTGISLRQNAVDPGFHRVPAAWRTRIVMLMVPGDLRGFTEMNGFEAEGYSGCSCHLCRFLACSLTRRRHLGM